MAFSGLGCAAATRDASIYQEYACQVTGSLVPKMSPLYPVSLAPKRTSAAAEPDHVVLVQKNERVSSVLQCVEMHAYCATQDAVMQCAHLGRLHHNAQLQQLPRHKLR